MLSILATVIMCVMYRNEGMCFVFESRHGKGEAGLFYFYHLYSLTEDLLCIKPHKGTNKMHRLSNFEPRHNNIIS